MTTYEDSKACKLIATHCLCCGRALVDAVSVETGIGPVCRKKYGYNQKVDEGTRKLANAIVYRIAAQPSTEEAVSLCEELRTMGFDTLATRVLGRITKPDVKVLVEGNDYLVKAPYVDEAHKLYFHHAGSCGKWDKELKARRFPRTPAMQLGIWKALNFMFPGLVVEGPKGKAVLNSGVTA